MTNRKSKKKSTLPKRRQSAEPTSYSIGSSVGKRENALDQIDLGDSQDQTTFAWTGPVRLLASVLIVTYLIVVLLGPLSNPVASPHFSQPLARAVSPAHQVLFQGHGYRFFGPDPGPSHRVVYKGAKLDGSTFDGVFPDRAENWPRLLYHRWFMLSETLFHEQALVPAEAELKVYKDEYETQIERLVSEGQTRLAEQLKQERGNELLAIEANKTRVTNLAAAIAKVICERNEATSVELFLQERALPFPEEVRDGVRISNPRFLGEPVRIGTLTEGEFQLSPEEVILPLPAESDRSKRGDK